MDSNPHVPTDCPQDETLCCSRPSAPGQEKTDGSLLVYFFSNTLIHFKIFPHETNTGGESIHASLI